MKSNWIMSVAPVSFGPTISIHARKDKFGIGANLNHLDKLFEKISIIWLLPASRFGDASLWSAGTDADKKKDRLTP